MGWGAHSRFATGNVKPWCESSKGGCLRCGPQPVSSRCHLGTGQSRAANEGTAESWQRQEVHTGEREQPIADEKGLRRSQTPSIQMRDTAALPRLLTSYPGMLGVFLESTHPISPFFGIKTKKAILPQIRYTPPFLPIQRGDHPNSPAANYL